MNHSYSHLLTMVFKHEYFEDGFFRSLELSYAQDTLKIMRGLDVIVKPFKGGFHLLSAKPELLALNSDHDPLQFYLSCKDPYYINYTVLPTYSPASSLLYFNNLDPVRVNVEDDASVFRLHSEGHVNEKGMLRLTHGQFKIKQFNPTSYYVFKDALNEDIPDQSIAMTGPDTGQMVISDMPEGVVRVFDGDTLVDSVYYYPKTVWKKPLGTIEIFTKTLSQHCQITKNGEEDKIDFIKADYSINFYNRETIWKYFLISKEYQKFNDLTIINSAREQIFEAEKEDAETLVLTSKQTLPLKEHPSDTFQLVNNFQPNQRSETVVLKHLVKPSPEQLYRDDKGTEATKQDETLYSHIYL